MGGHQIFGFSDGVDTRFSAGRWARSAFPWAHVANFFGLFGKCTWGGVQKHRGGLVGWVPLFGYLSSPSPRRSPSPTRSPSTWWSSGSSDAGPSQWGEGERGACQRRGRGPEGSLSVMCGSFGDHGLFQIPPLPQLFARAKPPRCPPDAFPIGIAPLQFHCHLSFLSEPRRVSRVWKAPALLRGLVSLRVPRPQQLFNPWARKVLDCPLTPDGGC